MVNPLISRIAINPNVMHGQACVKGTRVPVHLVVSMLAAGDTNEQILTDYPSITRADIQACLAYSASLAEEMVSPIEELLRENFG